MTSFIRTLLVMLVASATPALAQTVAFITNMKGEVAVDSNARPLILAELSRGQKLTVGRDAQLNVMYTASGKEFVLKPGEYEVREAEVVGASGAAAASRSTDWRASTKVLTQVAQTSGASVRMRSLAKPKVDDSPRLLYPTEGGVGTLQPQFRWRAADPKATGEFTLQVAGQEKPVHLAKVSGSSYRMATKLKPDTQYAWIVSTNGSEIGTGTFRTLPDYAINAIEKRRPSEKAEFSDRLLFALYLQEMGATQDAREGWARLAQERADLPELGTLAK